MLSNIVHIVSTTEGDCTYCKMEFGGQYECFCSKMVNVEHFRDGLE